MLSFPLIYPLNEKAKEWDVLDELLVKYVLESPRTRNTVTLVTIKLAILVREAMGEKGR